MVYTRVSSDKAKGRSVAEQETECRAECERRGWPVADVLTDNDRSATRFATKDRPEYARLAHVLQPVARASADGGEVVRLPGPELSRQ